VTHNFILAMNSSRSVKRLVSGLFKRKKEKISATAALADKRGEKSSTTSLKPPLPRHSAVALNESKHRCLAKVVLKLRVLAVDSARKKHGRRMIATCAEITHRVVLRVDRIARSRHQANMAAMLTEIKTTPTPLNKAQSKVLCDSGVDLSKQVEEVNGARWIVEIGAIVRVEDVTTIMAILIAMLFWMA
jgi:hypothetical protein